MDGEQCGAQPSRSQPAKYSSKRAGSSRKTINSAAGAVGLRIPLARSQEANLGSSWDIILVALEGGGNTPREASTLRHISSRKSPGPVNIDSSASHEDLKRNETAVVQSGVDCLLCLLRQERLPRVAVNISAEFESASGLLSEDLPRNNSQMAAKRRRSLGPDN